MHTRTTSFPYVVRIVLNFVTFKKIHELLFKAPVFVMLSLGVNIRNNVRRLGRTDREYAIPALPGEITKLRK